MLSEILLQNGAWYAENDGTTAFSIQCTNAFLAECQISMEWHLFICPRLGGINKGDIGSHIISIKACCSRKNWISIFISCWMLLLWIRMWNGGERACVSVYIPVHIMYKHTWIHSHSKMLICAYSLGLARRLEAMMERTILEYVIYFIYCYQILWWTKQLYPFINIWQTVTSMIKLFSVYRQ